MFSKPKKKKSLGTFPSTNVRCNNLQSESKRIQSLILNLKVYQKTEMGT